MKKTILTVAMALGISGAVMANVTLRLPEGSKDATYKVYKSLISDRLKPRAERPDPMIDSVMTVNGVATFDLNVSGPAQVAIILDDQGQNISLFASPEDNLNIDILSQAPLDYTVSGSPLMENISKLDKQSKEIVDKYRAAAGANDEAGAEAAQKEYYSLFKNFIAANPNDPASVYAILNLDGEDFITAFNAVPESLKTSILYPIAESQKAAVERQIEADKKLEALQSGNIPAPDFTLKNLEGKDVKLSDFRGKWVIIDFWGSWCGWCIKGFPKLKDAYEQYQPELEILGVDCNEPEANWRKGVEKYQLPWVNVYNPEGTTILADYGVQGFPTKVIVNPEGKIANITVGENPAFFDTLAKLINEK